MKSPFTCGFAIVASAFIAGGAAAQPAKPTRAETVFREGREAIARGDKKAGCAKIAESVSLARAAGPLLNLADCEEGDGHLIAALALWKEGFSALEPKDDRRPYAKERATKLEAKLPKLTVRVEPEVKEATVTIDGEAVPFDEVRAGRPVDPGAHTIVVKADGRSGRADVSIGIGEKKEATVALVPSTEGGSSSSGRPSTAMGTAAFVVGSAGVIGAAIFGVTTGFIQGDRKVVASECDARKFCTSKGLKAVEAGKALLPINAAALVIGAVGLSVGVTLFILSPPNKETSGAAAAIRVVGAPAAIRVVGAPDQLSASVVGVF